MNVIVAGRAVVLRQDDIDTDVLYPGPFLNIQDPAEMAAHLFEGLDPSVRDRLGGDTVLVVGANFGCGSSREHVVRAMRASGIRAVLGASIARIFYRNCVNLGLLAVAHPAAACAAKEGDVIAIEAQDGTVTIAGRPHVGTPVPAFVRETVAAGGLMERAAGTTKEEAPP